MLALMALAARLVEALEKEEVLLEAMVAQMAARHEFG